MAKKTKGKNKAAPAPPPPPPVLHPDDDDSDLVNDLLAQLDSRNKAVQEESAVVLNEMQLREQAEELEVQSKQSAKTRFQARQARKAAALAQNILPDDPETQAQLEKEAKDEEQAINIVCQQYDRQVFEINPDGHCLYSAVADQLMLLRVLPATQANYATMRMAAANFIEANPDDFLPFLPSTQGEDADGALDSGLMSPQEFQTYCSAVRSTAVWGGEPEIQALSRAFSVPVYVVQGGVPPVVIHDPKGNLGAEHITRKGGVWISYHRRMYGLGEHYNSLRPKSIP